MARPERHDADYFPFVCKDGRTLFIIEGKYQCKGTGFFTNVMRFLTMQPDHHACLESDADRMFFFTKTKCDEASGTDMLNIMATTGKIDNQLWINHRVVVSEDLIKSLEGAYINRKNKIITLNEIRVSYNNNPITYTGNTASAVLNPETEGYQQVSYTENPQKKREETKRKESMAPDNLHLPVDNSKTEDEDCPPFDPPKPESEKPKAALSKQPENQKPKNGNTHGERWTPPTSAKRDERLDDIMQRYGMSYHGRVMAWVRMNLNRCNPDAMIRCLERLISDRLAGKSIPIPEAWLEATLNGTKEGKAGENQKAEAEEFDRQQAGLKGPPTARGLATMRQVLQQVGAGG